MSIPSGNSVFFCWRGTVVALSLEMREVPGSCPGLAKVDTEDHHAQVRNEYK